MLQLFMSTPWLSSEYITQPSSTCLILFEQAVACALPLARDSAGSNVAAKIAMIAMTTNSSIRVKPRDQPEASPSTIGRLLRVICRNLMVQEGPILTIGWQDLTRIWRACERHHLSRPVP